MIALPLGTRVWIAAGATDMRKSIDGLAALVSQVFRLDPFAPSLFVFCNRVRAVCLNPPLLNLLVWAANRRPDLKLRLMHIVLGLRP